MREVAAVAEVESGGRGRGVDEEGIGRSGATQAMIAKDWACPSPLYAPSGLRRQMGSPLREFEDPDSGKQGMEIGMVIELAE